MAFSKMNITSLTLLKKIDDDSRFFFSSQKLNFFLNAMDLIGVNPSSLDAFEVAIWYSFAFSNFETRYQESVKKLKKDLSNVLEDKIIKQSVNILSGIDLNQPMIDEDQKIMNDIQYSFFAFNYEKFSIEINNFKKDIGDNNLKKIFQKKINKCFYSKFWSEEDNEQAKMNIIKYCR